MPLRKRVAWLIVVMVIGGWLLLLVTSNLWKPLLEATFVVGVAAAFVWALWVIIEDKFNA